MLGPEGYVVPQIEQKVSQIVKKDKMSFLTEEEEEESAKAKQQSAAESLLNKYPLELKCPFGDHIIIDAVLIPCCGHFVCCDLCIRQKISNDENVECPHEECDQEIGSLISITPYHEIRKKVTDYLNDVKLSVQRASITNNSNISNVTNKDSTTTNDPFFDLILSGVNGKPSDSQPNLSLSPVNQISDKDNPVSNQESLKEDQKPSGSESPLQDSKISSSQQQLNNANGMQTSVQANKDQLSDSESKKTTIPTAKIDTPPAMQPALLPTPPLISEPVVPINAQLKSNMIKLTGQPPPAQGSAIPTTQPFVSNINPIRSSFPVNDSSFMSQPRPPVQNVVNPTSYGQMPIQPNYQMGKIRNPIRNNNNILPIPNTNFGMNQQVQQPRPNLNMAQAQQQQQQNKQFNMYMNNQMRPQFGSQNPQQQPPQRMYMDQMYPHPMHQMGNYPQASFMPPNINPVPNQFGPGGQYMNQPGPIGSVPPPQMGMPPQTGMPPRNINPSLINPMPGAGMQAMPPTIGPSQISQQPGIYPPQGHIPPPLSQNMPQMPLNQSGLGMNPPVGLASGLMSEQEFYAYQESLRRKE